MEENIPGYCALCISRCGCMSIVKDGVLVAVEPLPDHPTGKTLCMKGRAAPEMVYSSERILTPLKRSNPKSDPDPGWQPISWQEALSIVVDKMQAAKALIGPEAVCFGVTTPSGTGVSDSFVLINRLAHAFGSPNTLFATENCNWHKDFVPKYTFGNTLGMPEYENSGCIILWGFNPVVSWLAQAELINRASKRGAKLIVIDPRRVGFANRANEWLRVRPATDGPLAMALAYQLIINNDYDANFVRQWSNGVLLVRADTGELMPASQLAIDGCERANSRHYLAWNERCNEVVLYDPESALYWSAGDLDKEGVEPSTKIVDPNELALFGSFGIPTQRGPVLCAPAFQLYADECSQYTAEVSESITDIPAKQIKRVAQLIAKSGPVSYFTWTGTAQQKEATQTSRAIALLYALTGDLDRCGGNVYFSKPPIANLFGLELLSEQQKAKTLGKRARPLGPSTMGWVSSLDLYRSISHGKPYSTRVVVSFGGNPLATKPNADSAIESLKQLDFYLHADMFHNPTSQYADIILPVASPWERPGFYPGFQVSQQAETCLHLRPAAISPKGESKSDAWIVFELSKRLKLEDKMFNGDPREALKALLEPMGQGDALIDRLESHPEGLSLSAPLASTYQKYIEEGFDTPSKKVEIFSSTFYRSGYAPIPVFAVIRDTFVNRLIKSDEEFPLYLISAKEMAYCHSQQRNISSLKKRQPEPLVEMNPHTATRYGISGGDWISIVTRNGAMRAKAKIRVGFSDDTVCCQYGWWQNEGSTQWNYNALISDLTFDLISSSNELRSTLCRIEK